jgi:hypothetical protein
MAWLTLLAAGLLEVAFAASLKPAEGFSRLGPSLAVIVFGTAAVVTLTQTLDRIPVGTAYAAFHGDRCGGHGPGRHARLPRTGLAGPPGLRRPGRRRRHRPPPGR